MRRFWTRTELSAAEEIAGLLRHVGWRRPAGGGTLMTESLLVLRRNRGDLDVFDQGGNRVGSARSARRSGWIQFGSSRDYEFVDAADTCVFRLQDIGSHWKGSEIKWVYELRVPNSPETTKLERIDRSTGTAAITQGRREVGWLRPFKAA